LLHKDLYRRFYDRHRPIYAAPPLNRGGIFVGLTVVLSGVVSDPERRIFMAKYLKQRQRLILEALLNNDRQGTTAEAAAKTKLNVNGVSQSLGAMEGEYVEMGPLVRGGKQTWKLIKDPPSLTKQLRRKLNLRRAQLIGKKAANSITDEELIELEDLRKTVNRFTSFCGTPQPQRGQQFLQFRY
jgi:hypothetical protein